MRDGFEKRALELGTVETKRSARASVVVLKKKLGGAKRTPRNFVVYVFINLEKCSFNC